MNYKIILAAVALGVITTGATLWSTGVIKAQGNGNNQNMSQELADKLNIDQAKVTDAMDQIRSEHQAERQKQNSANLDKAVSDKVITAEQKQKILDRQSEMQKKRGQERTEQQTWASENGIDMTKLRTYGVGMGMGMGGHGRGGFDD